MPGLGLRRAAAGLALVFALALASGCAGKPAGRATPETAAGTAPPAGFTLPPLATPETAGPESAAAGTLAYRAVWISYLEWAQMDFSSETAFARQADTLAENAAELGLNTLIAQVRPFADALYPSALYPFSHVCTGTQGQSPGFDPLAVLTAAAHAHGLSLEAWVNPYRIAASGAVPGTLAQSNLYYTHPDWVKAVGDGLYLDPANTAAQQYIADGLAELCQNYAIDGIQFDDYFYPTTDPAFDAAQYAAYTAGGGAAALEDWRRQNVNSLVCLCYRTVHGFPGVRFGISPQGNPDMDYSAQYSDAALWLSTPGYCDYLMPQLYWGIGYTKGGATRLALPNLAKTWLALPRSAAVQLYFGLAASDIGTGDGGDAPAEWSGGSAIADQAACLRELGGAGFALYRYGALWNNTAWPALAAAERENLKTLLNP